MSDNYCVFPKEIDDRIPDYFYYAMAGELVSIFGPDILEKMDYPEYDDDGNLILGNPNVDASYYDLDSGTGGWLAAFKMTCKKLDMMWLMEYREGLVWYDIDILDGIIEERIIRIFVEKDHSQDHANCYYKHIIGYEKMKNEKAGITLKEIIEQLGNKSYPYIEVRYRWKESGKESDIFAGACSYDNKTGQLTSIDGDSYSLYDRYIEWNEWLDDDYLESGEEQMILTVWEEIK